MLRVFLKHLGVGWMNCSKPVFIHISFVSMCGSVLFKTICFMRQVLCAICGEAKQTKQADCSGERGGLSVSTI